MSESSQYSRYVLNERPPEEANLEDHPNTFREEKLNLKDLKPGQGEVVVQVTWLSLDPAMRGYLKDVRSYMPPVQIGEVMRGMGLGVVVKAGEGSKLKPKDTVSGAFGWTEYAVMPEKQLEKIVVPPNVKDIDFLNTLGTSGLTAYFGLQDICTPKPGETLVISGAAGSVGAVACQLGKRMGAKVIAIAGSPDKCEWLEKELGVDQAFNYKAPNFAEQFRKIGYVDCYFDNVGGDLLNMILGRLNKDARIALCGAISTYNSKKPPGLTNYLALIGQRAKLEGFLVFDYVDRFPEAIKEIAAGLADGSIKSQFHIVQGLRSAPKALPMLFQGGNTGKLLVKVSNVNEARL